MRIVIPVSKFDAEHFVRQVGIMVNLGGLTRHIITIVPSPSQFELATSMAGALKTVCDEVEVWPMPVEGEGDVWPQNCNAMWQFAAAQLYSRGNKVPWFWMEADCLPIKAGWADKLDVTYAKAGKAYMGYITPTPSEFPDGTPGPFVDGDDMMMGCSIYHPDTAKFGHESYLFADLKNAQQGGINTPWDIYLRWVFRQQGWEHTELIGNFWRTKNFRVEDGELVCDLIGSEQRDGNRRKTKVSSECYLVHGCKDFSLATIIETGHIQEVVDKKPEEVGSVPYSEWKKMVERVAKIEAMLWEMKTQQAEGVAVVVPTDMTTNSSAISDDEVFGGVIGVVEVTHAPKEKKLLELLKTKKTRLNEAIRFLGVEREQAIKFLNTNGYVVGAASWIQQSR